MNLNDITHVVFDFNGTLLWDMDLHDIVWNETAVRLRGWRCSEEETRTLLHGRTTHEIFAVLMGRSLTDVESHELAEKKEQEYRTLISSKPERMQLVKGATALFAYLSQKGIPIAIATASGQSNVNFYKEVFQLNKWFTDDCIVYADGSLPGKPHPDLFLSAMSRIGATADTTLIVEDAQLGVEAARRAGAGMVVGIWSDEATRERLLEQNQVDFLIQDYQELIDKWQTKND